jgi:hypothetical protein
MGSQMIDLRCPCEDGKPDPCTLCGADAKTGVCGASRLDKSVFKFTAALEFIVNLPNIIKVIGIDKFNEIQGLLGKPYWPYDSIGACKYCRHSQFKGHQRSCRAIEGPSHVCGLSGYNGMIDPPCPQCEWQRLCHQRPTEVVREGFTLTTARI